MYTRCPHCQTLFRVHPQQLSAAKGRARCSHCGEVFDAIENLQTDATQEPPAERPPAAPPRETPAQADAPQPSQPFEPATGETDIPSGPGDVFVSLGAEEPAAEKTAVPHRDEESGLGAELQRMSEFYEQALEQTPDLPAGLTPPPSTRVPLDTDTLTLAPPGIDIHSPAAPFSEGSETAPAADNRWTTAPAGAEGPAPLAADTGAPPESPEEAPFPVRKKPGPRHRLAWFLGSLLLLAAALAQLGWMERERLLKDPRSRVLLEQACSWLDCRLPVVSEPGRIQVLQRSVISHPFRPDSLLIQLTFANQAPFPQPYPLLQLTMFDRNGTPLARRSFTPAQYLEAPVGDDSLLQPGQKINIEMALLDPGAEATGFKFDFLPPSAGDSGR